MNKHASRSNAGLPVDILVGGKNGSKRMSVDHVGKNSTNAETFPLIEDEAGPSGPIEDDDISSLGEPSTLGVTLKRVELPMRRNRQPSASSHHKSSSGSSGQNKDLIAAELWTGKQPKTTSKLAQSLAEMHKKLTREEERNAKLTKVFKETQTMAESVIAEVKRLKSANVELTAQSTRVETDLRTRIAQLETENRLLRESKDDLMELLHQREAELYYEITLPPMDENSAARGADSSHHSLLSRRSGRRANFSSRSMDDYRKSGYDNDEDKGRPSTSTRSLSFDDSLVAGLRSRLSKRSLSAPMIAQSLANEEDKDVGDGGGSHDDKNSTASATTSSRSMSFSWDTLPPPPVSRMRSKRSSQ